MINEENFLDELLLEAEEKEEQQTEAFYDLLLLQIKKMNQQIASNFIEAEKECKIINNWALSKNSLLAEKIRFLELKLQAFIIERKEKTIDLANGTLKFHKKQDKVEITDLDLFLKHARPQLLNIIPEQIKPDMTKIRSFIKTRPVPPGVKVTEGKEEFTYKLKGEKEDGREKETGIGIEQTAELRAAI